MTSNNAPASVPDPSDIVPTVTRSLPIIGSAAGSVEMKPPMTGPMAITADPPLPLKLTEPEAQAALEDKQRLSQWLVPGTVADLGAGDGTIASHYASLPATSTVYALEENINQLHKLHARHNLDVLHGGSERLAEIAGLNTSAIHGYSAGDPDGIESPSNLLNNIVFCSVLHQVYSRSGRYLAVHQAIDQAVAALVPGGRLIIRDGVAPDAPNRTAKLTAPHLAATYLVRDYAALSPFCTDISIQRSSQSQLEWVGTRAVLAEALLSVNWGAEALVYESQTKYQLATFDNYPGSILRTAENKPRPLQLVHAESYTQPGYLEHLKGWTLSDTSTGDQWFPDTNAVWVFEKI